MKVVYTINEVHAINGFSNLVDPTNKVDLDRIKEDIARQDENSKVRLTLTEDSLTAEVSEELVLRVMTVMVKHHIAMMAIANGIKAMVVLFKSTVDGIKEDLKDIL